MRNNNYHIPSSPIIITDETLPNTYIGKIKRADDWKFRVFLMEDFEEVWSDVELCNSKGVRKAIFNVKKWKV